MNKSPNHASVHYLRLLSQIALAVEDSQAPYDIGRELQGGYMDPRWSTLQGSAGWNGFDYVLVANGHLERGESLASYLPELETDYSYALRLEPADLEYANALAPPDSVLLYPSGAGPNLGFHRNSWNRAHWAMVVRLLNEVGIAPVLMGANTPDDCGYRDRVVALLGGGSYVDAVGKTSVGQAMALIQQAGVWCGLNSGLGIVSAMLGTPTVMLWADKRYPIRNTVAFDPRMQRSWLAEEQLDTYRTLSFGSPELTPAAVVHAVLEVGRARSRLVA